LRLLDVNFLSALALPNHEFHRIAIERPDNSNKPWATCALTQLAFIRISCNPYKPEKSPAETVAARDYSINTLGAL
jgi:predicted nucleic acid-binding protein